MRPWTDSSTWEESVCHLEVSMNEEVTRVLSNVEESIPDASHASPDASHAPPLTHPMPSPTHPMPPRRIPCPPKRIPCLPGASHASLTHPLHPDASYVEESVHARMNVTFS
ncbi:hypothetical protein Hanom_Chr16g01416481 [Helianthus anomalus]